MHAGHTHFAWDQTLDDGVRYIQAALAYPTERQQRMVTLAIGNLAVEPVFIYDCADAVRKGAALSRPLASFLLAHC